MSNEFYTHTGYPSNSEDAQAIDVRSEFLAIQAMADKLPALTGNALELVQINAGGNGLTSMKVAIGIWTPTFAFTTPGNSVFAYTVRDGYYVRIGPLVLVAFSLLFSTFTHTTASGNARITGLPFNITVVNTAYASGGLHGSGITKANYTQLLGMIGVINLIQLVMRGSAQPQGDVTAADMPTGGTPSFNGSILYRTDD